MFNPKVKDFLEEKKDITVIGLYWAGYWRLMSFVLGGYLALLVFVALVEYLGY